MHLPIEPPFAPMEALLVEEIPIGENWQYEPKWDGFRCLVFRDGAEVQLQLRVECENNWVTFARAVQR